MEQSHIGRFVYGQRLISFHCCKGYWNWFESKAWAIGINNKDTVEVDGLCCFISDEHREFVGGVMIFFGEDDIEYCKQYKDGDLIQFACNYYGLDKDEFQWGIEYASI